MAPDASDRELLVRIDERTKSLTETVAAVMAGNGPACQRENGRITALENTAADHADSIRNLWDKKAGRDSLKIYAWVFGLGFIGIMGLIGYFIVKI